MEKIAIIGSGISGLTVANLLKDKYDITVFEKESIPGGLVRCKIIDGSLFHTCGGHIFNSKRQDVLDWFWSLFNQEAEFIKADRNSVVYIDSKTIVPYPIENHIFYFNNEIQKSIINDWLKLYIDCPTKRPENFSDFLLNRFGDNLYNLYFKPYNEKVWRCDLKDVPLNWLEGKLPMPTVSEMFFNNINHIKEKLFVHSSFWYEKHSGSQFLVDRLSKGLNIVLGSNIDSINFVNGKWKIQNLIFDKVFFCGNIKDIVNIVHGINIEGYRSFIEKLSCHGTTSVFCEIDKNSYSWVYQPDQGHRSHRIICTGNFSNYNNSTSLSKDRITATIEFTDEINKNDILEDLAKMPFHPKYIDHKYNKYTYPIQNNNTREQIKEIKSMLSNYSFYITGRFADWEYYNMDMAMGAAMDLCSTI